MDFTRVWKISMVNTSLDCQILQAKIILGLSSSLKTEELQSEEIHEKFIQKLAMVLKLRFNILLNIYFKSSLPNSKIDTR